MFASCPIRSLGLRCRAKLGAIVISVIRAVLAGFHTGFDKSLPLTSDAVLLRRLEHFRGILFLTTNRPAQIDEAFTSRMQALIGYPRLTDDKQNNAWETFFDKPIEDMKSEMKKGGRNAASK